ncbi:hypothetical protein BZA05DRAFT_419618 [Tricharina praecox]|uniref:uncharacterized protein n=1 Tax=Tricharina praecox TaxID=43433 RepID=UPI00221FD985|nr:uncharacterized protein BZA05DRAFT_419618 [Tricharina praecox]KAI5849805.1 hypothetical protein BZA05DRAFT_419618 [Tricharina praecox]
MARTGVYNAGSSHKTAVSSIVEQIDNDTYRQMKDFHNHSKECKPCRNPVIAYQQGRDLCTTGRTLCIAITKLLYKKAEHVGVFTVDYKNGWEAVDGLIRIIVHYNQGYFSTEIVDIKKREAAPAPVPTIEAPPRGSQWEEDTRRREQAARSRHSSSPRTSNTGFSHYSGSPRNSNTNVAHYGGNPRTSYLDTSTAQTQADVSPASSHRSVHFDSHVHVREFTNP